MIMLFWQPEHEGSHVSSSVHGSVAAVWLLAASPFWVKKVLSSMSEGNILV